jgi:hypothetical protein
MGDTGKVNIHGKEYETVASRVQRFRKEHADKYGIITDVISRADEIVVKATIIRYGEVLKDKDGAYTDQAVIATGFAEERRDSSSINRTSALENAETSAIGRALANFGMAGTEYATADEVAQAIHQQQTPTKPASAPAKPADHVISPAQAGMLLGRAKQASGLNDRSQVLEFFLETTGLDLAHVKQSQLEEVLAKLGGDGEVA